MKEGEGMEGSFWEVCANSKEGNILICLDYSLQNIVNNGDYTFMWEEEWTPVKLTGEYLGMRWKIIK
jgi:hypothetical protein